MAVDISSTVDERYARYCLRYAVSVLGAAAVIEFVATLDARETKILAPASYTSRNRTFSPLPSDAQRRGQQHI